MTRRPAVVLALTVAALLPAGTAVAAAPASAKNCTALQKTHAHGVGLKTARDKTSGKPVTTFRKDDAEYKRVLKLNKGLDRDKDGIACEKR